MHGISCKIPANDNLMIIAGILVLSFLPIYICSVGSPDLAYPQSHGFWYGNQTGNGTPPLRKYHVASRSVKGNHVLITCNS